MNVYLPNKRLPSEYQEVDWIQSSGTQWIDTGVTPNQNTKSQIKFITYDTDMIYGYTYSEFTDYRFFNYKSRCYFDMYSSRIETSGGSEIVTNTLYELELGNYYVKNLSTGTNIVSGSTQSAFTGNRTIRLNHEDSWTGDNGTVYPAVSGSDRWYYVKIYNGSTLVRDMVPCYRKSDSVIGLYDLVNNQFYTNAGTGTFSKGNDVTMSELKNAYIGEVWTPNANTLLYLPLEKDAIDYSGNSRSTTPSNITYASLGGVMCANGNGSSSKISVTPTDIVVGSTEGTVSMLVYYTGSISDYRMAMNFNRYGSYGLGIGLYSSKWTFWTNSTDSSFTPASPLSTNNWYHVLYTIDSNGSIAYINGTQVASGTKTTGSVRGDGSNDSAGNQYIFCSRGGNNNYWKGGIREVIIEKRKRSATDVSNYYSMIKQKLGF